ncbi:hypothetical protein ASE79_00195 [Sphingomonas sp. Leaf28]|nr:hypothetical protein ASE79_00195 [Sphingomonas sp. Leaf28]
MVVYSVPQPECRRYSIVQTTHQTALETKHAVLDQRIAAETHRPLPDAAILAQLKKQKLRLKEEIVSL